MPALRNQRQERFCHLVKQGLPVLKAYPLAGYKPHISNGWRLSKNEQTKRRIAELTRSFAMKTRVTVESLTDELDQAAALAARNDQAGAMVQAIATKAKLHGHLIERKETGAPGDFSALQSAEEIVAKVRAELGDRAADVLKALVSAETAQADQAQTMQEPKGNC